MFGDPEFQDGLRRQIIAICEGMARRPTEFDRGRFLTLWDRIVAPRFKQRRPEKLKEMDPRYATTYLRLSGFGDNTRKYLSRSGQAKKLSKISFKHIECVWDFLVEMKVCSATPVIDGKELIVTRQEPARWKEFLDYALGKVAQLPSLATNGLTPENGLAAAGTKNNRATGPLLIPGSHGAPEVWHHKVLFSAQQAIEILNRPFSAGIIERSKLHLTENRQALTDYVVEEVYRHPNIENVKNLIQLMTFYRTYLPFEKNEKLWFESEEILYKNSGDRFSPALVKTRKYLDLRKSPRDKIYPSFIELADRFLNMDDMRGYCEATIKASYAYLNENEAQKARMLLWKCKERYDRNATTPIEYSGLYIRPAFGMLADLYIAITRCEICLGNLKAAVLFSNYAFDYATKARDFHIMGNVNEDRAMLALKNGQFAQAQIYNAGAVRCFEEHGDIVRASLSKQLLIRHDDSQWLNKITGRVSVASTP